MKITALKSGKFAHPEPGKPQINVREGKEYDVDGTMGASIIDSGWGAVPSEDAPAQQIEDMTKSDLEKYAEYLGIEGVTQKMKRNDMLAAIRAQGNE